MAEGPECRVIPPQEVAERRPRSDEAHLPLSTRKLYQPNSSGQGGFLVNMVVQPSAAVDTRHFQDGRFEGLTGQGRTVPVFVQVAQDQVQGPGFS